MYYHCSFMVGLNSCSRITMQCAAEKIVTKCSGGTSTIKDDVVIAGAHRYFSRNPSFRARFVCSILLAFTLCKNFVIKTTGTYRCRERRRWRHRDSLNYWKRTNPLPRRASFIHISAHSRSFFSSVNTYVCVYIYICIFKIYKCIANNNYNWIT